MKIFIYSLIIALLGFLLRNIVPWWSIVIIAAIVGAFTNFSSISAFFMGFVGAALLWGVYVLLVNTQNESVMALKMGQLLGDTSPLVLILITTLLGGLLGGMGALTGHLGSKAFKPSSR